MIHEGFPFIVHRDEEVVFKRPFKRLYQFLEGDFSTTTNLFDIFLLGWYGLGFIIGKILGFWKDFSEFKDLLILQDPYLLIWGRLLSTLYVAIGNVLVCQFLTRFTSKRSSLVLVALCILVNPILLPSVFLMKLEGLVYLYSCILFILSYLYIVEGRNNLQFWVYAACSFSIAIRVELLVFPLILLIHDIYEANWPIKWEGVRMRAKGLMIGLGLGILVSFYPLFLIFNWLQPSPVKGLEPQMSYGDKIIGHILHNLQQPSFLEQAGNTLVYYLDLLILVLGPFLLLMSLLSFKKRPRHRLYALHLLILVGIISFFGHSFVHYALSLSLILELIAFVWALQSPNKYKNLLLFLHLIWTGSLSLIYLYQIDTYPSPLLKTRTFLLENSDPNELLAIESLSGASVHPHIWECEIEAKIQAAKQVSKFGGTQYQIVLERGINQPCRRQIDICEINYIAKEEYQSNSFVNTLDIPHLEQIRPDWYVSANQLEPSYAPLEKRDSFYNHVLIQYALDTVFRKDAHFFDSRTRKINIRKTFYVYKRKNY